MQRAVILGGLVFVAVLAVGWVVLVPPGGGLGTPWGEGEAAGAGQTGLSPLVAERADAEAACAEVLEVVKRRWSEDMLEELAKVVFDERGMPVEEVARMCQEVAGMEEDALLAEVTRVTGVRGEPGNGS